MKPAFIFILLLFAINQSSAEVQIKDEKSPDFDKIILNLVNTTDNDNRNQISTDLIKKYKLYPDPNLVLVVRRQLYGTLDSKYSGDQREAIAALAGQLHDEDAIPFLVEHLKDGGTSKLLFGNSLSTFRAEYPYGSALIYFKGSAIKPVLDAVNKSKNPIFDHAAAELFDYMPNTCNDLISYYKLSQHTANARTFIIQILRNHPEANSGIDAAIANESDPNKKHDMIELKAAINLKPH